VSSRPCHRPRVSFFADSFRGDPHGTDPKFVRITEVFSLQFFGGTGGTGGTPRDLMLQRWYQPVGPVCANFVFHGQSVMVVPPVPPISTTKISIRCLQYPRYHRYRRNACHGSADAVRIHRGVRKWTTALPPMRRACSSKSQMNSYHSHGSCPQYRHAASAVLGIRPAGN